MFDIKFIFDLNLVSDQKIRYDKPNPKEQSIATVQRWPQSTCTQKEKVNVVWDIRAFVLLCSAVPPS